MKNVPNKADSTESPSFITWSDEKGKALAMVQSGQALIKSDPLVLRSTASNIYQGISPGNVSVRDSFGRNDYNRFRQDEAVPTSPRGKMIACNHVYKNIGIIRNIIDLMSDFATQGISLSHPNEKINNFYTEWFRRAGGKQVSERFVNYLYRLGITIARRQTAKITVRTEDDMRRTSADADIIVEDAVKPSKREIPWKYTFQNPMKVDIAEEELSMFADNNNLIYQINISPKIVSMVKKPTNEIQKKIVASMPPEIVKSIRGGDKKLILDPSKTRTFHYKRDDWEPWADPLTFAILTDIRHLEKLKLADLAALDGVISSIRVWKLGSLEHKMMPGENVINRLAQMLMNSVGGGVMDLVWGPGIELVETASEAYKFLGESKYVPCLTAIHAGLGIPGVLSGASEGGGLTNNYISLKTLTERLQYARDALTAFWNEEVRIVQRAMGFRVPATVIYDRMTLTDEASEKTLLMNLADRDFISIETLQERVGECPEIEAVRLRKQLRRQDKKLSPAKAGPFHSAGQEHDLKKIYAQHGGVAPSELGIQLADKKPGEQTPAEIKNKFAVQQKEAGTKLKGQPGQGRPKNANDKTKRKQKTVKPRKSAAFISNIAKATATYTSIAEVATPIYLKAIGKKSLRELTNVETSGFEEFKFCVLANTEIGSEVTVDTLKEFSKNTLTVPAPMQELLKTTISMYIEQNGKEPSLDIVRGFQTNIVALWNSEDETRDSGDSV